MHRQAETTVGPRPVTPVAAMDDGSILAAVNPAHIDTLVVEIWDGQANLRSPLGTHLAHEPRTWVGGINRTEVFGWDLKLAPWGDLAVVTSSERYEIRAFAKDGTLARIVRMEHALRAPTRADVEGWIEAEVVRQVPEPLVGLVATPEGLTIHEIGEDYILGRVEDELGVNYVQLWPLERVGAG